MASHDYIDDDDDNFEEDGCTFDFSDETGVSSGVGGVADGPLYRVYEGEDFGQYLDDDAHPPPQGMLPSWDNGQELDAAGGREDSSRRRKSTTLLREKLGRLLLTGTGGGKSRHAASTVPQNSGYRIHEVSFADCKMGNSLADRSATGHSAPGSDSGIDCRSGYSLETESDLGPPRSSTWWDMDTLSSRRQPRSSTSALELRHSPSPSSSISPASRPLDATEVTDVGLLRSQQQQEKSRDVKRLSNPFRKIYNTINRRKSANLQEMSYNQDYEDIRL